MKPIVWTKHARDAQAERPLPDSLVERVAREPEWTEPDPDPEVQRRFRTLPELDGRVLRVACAETQAHIRIITFTLDRNARRETAMNTRYDPEADGLIVRLAEGDYYDSAEVHPGFTLDFDKDGRVLGFEVLPASKVLGPGAWSLSAVDAGRLEAAE